MPGAKQVTRCFLFFFLAVSGRTNASDLPNYTTLQMVAGFDWPAWPSYRLCFSSLSCPHENKRSLLCRSRTCFGRFTALELRGQASYATPKANILQPSPPMLRTAQPRSQHKAETVCNKEKSDFVAAQSEGRGLVSFPVSASRWYQYNVCLRISPI